MSKLFNTLLRSAGLCSTAALIALAITATPALAQSTSPKIVKKVPLDFPDEAVRKGIDRGVLKTRITVDAGGAPTEVIVVETLPVKARILNDTVIAALKNWRWEGQGKPTSFDLQIVFTSE